jgi:hypothetical protein
MKRYEMKEFNKLVTGLKNSEAKKDMLIDDLIRNALYHSVVNNQSTPTINLVNALSKSTRKNDIISFMVRAGNLAYTQEKGIHAKLKPDADIKACWKEEEKAWAYVESLPSFWDVVKEQKVKTEWDMESALHNLVRAYRHHLNKAHKTVIKEQDQEMLNSLLARFPAKS